MRATLWTDPLSALIEFCGLVGTLIVDEDGTYSAQDPNDRLLLGMKATMSELELSLLHARSMKALRQSSLSSNRE